MPCLRRVRFLRLFAAVGVLMAGMLTACTPRSAAQRPAPSLRVMTYNIQAGGGDLASIAAVIRGADVDLAALQEVDVHWNTRSAFADQAEELPGDIPLQSKRPSKIRAMMITALS